MTNKKPFVHSFSASKKFKQCPLIFYEDRVLKKFPFVQGDAAKRGDAVHLALANFIKRSIVIPEELRDLLLDYAKSLKARPGRKLVEQKLGIRKDGSPCDFFDQDAYSRGIFDYVNINEAGDEALLVDHKTGKDSYPDVDQLLDNAVTLFAHYPKLRRIKAALAFVDHGTMVSAEFDREYLDDYLDQVLSDCAEIDIALQKQDFPARSGPLCPWCPKTDCKNWRPPPKK